MGKTSIHVNGNYVKISFSDLLLWNGCTPITFSLNEQRITGSLMSLLHASPGSQKYRPMISEHDKTLRPNAGQQDLSVSHADARILSRLALPTSFYILPYFFKKLLGWSFL